ncbi:unnamed protein product, partial [Nesidiocoris tenuis]
MVFADKFVIRRRSLCKYRRKRQRGKSSYILVAMARKDFPTDVLNTRLSQILGLLPLGFGGHFETFQASSCTGIFLFSALLDIYRLLKIFKKQHSFFDAFNTLTAVVVSSTSYLAIVVHIVVSVVQFRKTKSFLCSNYNNRTSVNYLTIFAAVLLTIATANRFTSKVRPDMVFRYSMSCLCIFLHFLIAAQYFQLTSSSAMTWRYLGSRLCLIRGKRRKTQIAKCASLSDSVCIGIMKIHRFYHRQIFVIALGLFIELTFYGHLIITYAVLSNTPEFSFVMAFILPVFVKMLTLFLIATASEAAAVT